MFFCFEEVFQKATRNPWGLNRCDSCDFVFETRTVNNGTVVSLYFRLQGKNTSTKGNGWAWSPWRTILWGWWRLWGAEMDYCVFDFVHSLSKLVGMDWSRNGLRHIQALHGLRCTLRPAIFACWAFIWQSRCVQLGRMRSPSSNWTPGRVTSCWVLVVKWLFKWHQLFFCISCCNFEDCVFVSSVMQVRWGGIWRWMNTDSAMQMSASHCHAYGCRNLVELMKRMQHLTL